MPRSIVSKVFFTCFYSIVACMTLTVGQAKASLVGDSVEVSFLGSFGPGDPYIDIVEVVSPKHEFVYEDPAAEDPITDIGSRLIKEGEHIDIDASSISFRVISLGEGNLTTIGGVVYDETGYRTGEKFVFSSLDFSGVPGAILTGVTISLLNMANPDLASAVFFTSDSVTLNMEGFLVAISNIGAADFGNISLNLQFESATPVPLPGSLILFISGLAFLSCSMISKRKIARAV